MKTIKLFLDFFTRNKIKMLALLIIMTASMILLANVIIQNNYYQYSAHFFYKDELKDTVYVQAARVFDMNIKDENGKTYYLEYPEDYTSLEDYQKKHNALQEKIWNEPLPYKSQEFSAVKNVYYLNYMLGEYNNEFATIQLSTKETYQVFDLALSEGEWLYNCKQTSPYPNAVLCGYAYKDVKIGDDIEITINEQKFKVHTVGKVQSPYFVISLNDSASYPGGICLYQSAHTSERIFLLDDDFTRNAIQAPIFTDSSFFVSFKDDATPEEKKEFFDYLSQYSGETMPAYLDGNEITESTVQQIQDMLYIPLRRSIFYIAVATFTLISIAIIVTKKKLMEHYTYYLCGCSRRKSFLLLWIGLFSAGILATIITYLYLIYSHYSMVWGFTPGSAILIDGYTFLYIFLYMLVISLISLVITFFSFKKYTPIELYRSKEGKL